SDTGGRTAPREPAVVLTATPDASNVAKALDEFSPPHEGYRKLKAKLAELRGTNGPEDDKFVRIPDGPTVKPGATDARIPLLRKRLDVPGEEDSLRYDNDLVAAVKAYQKGKGANADGVLSANTVRLLNGAAPPRRTESIDTVIINMERWRWLPRDLGKIYVMVNIPDYTLRVMKDGHLHWPPRIGVGK